MAVASAGKPELWVRVEFRVTLYSARSQGKIFIGRNIRLVFQKITLMEFSGEARALS